MINNGSKGTVRFAVQPASKVTEVLLAGTFNNWKPEKMAKQKNGAFVASKSLAPGDYKYKFVIDGKWVPDSDNPRQIPNPFGSMDSVVHVSR
jgi:1,4-alpha-glucan branching enzyme